MQSTFKQDWENLIASFEPVKKTGENPHFGNRHVELKNLLPLVKEHCKKNNFFFFQAPQMKDGKSCLETKFLHKDGESVNGIIELVHKPEDPQKLGGSITYMRRYMLTCMLGIEENDDDGNMASGHTKKSPVRTVKDISSL